MRKSQRDVLVRNPGLFIGSPFTTDHARHVAAGCGATLPFCNVIVAFLTIIPIGMGHQDREHTRYQRSFSLHTTPFPFLEQQLLIPSALRGKHINF